MDTDDETSYNIFDWFPEDICEDIFNNLTENDLLTASLVTADWYNFIAKSPVCMKKIKLVFSHKTLKALTPDVKEMLKTSSRRYENFNLLCQMSKLDELIEILKVPGRKWKRLYLSNITFSSTAACMDFLSIFDESIEELRMDKVYIDTIYYNGPKKMLTFPKLKFLESKYIQTLIYYQAFVNCTNLNEFNITSGDQSWASMQALHKMFRCNKGLKKLSIITHVFTQFFNVDFSNDVEFKLTSLEARDIYNLSDTHKKNFRMFMQKQMMTLEKLNIGDWMGMEIVRMCFHMPRLTAFVFKGFHNAEDPVDWKETKFHRSISLTTLHVIETNGRLDIVQAFIKAAPNVKHLKLYTIKDETLNIVSSILPNLETLTTDLFEATNISDINLFLNLREFSAKAFKKRFNENDNPTPGNFEKLVVEAVKKVWSEGDEPKVHYCGYGRFGSFRR